ncbi:MAG TPA: DUF6371 domain-containing protein, partial [Bacteroidia bacterium]|nr:DUF6371 domain-containing protein [Bacteroidia bacterium]
YELDKSSRKFECPGCHKKRFVRYIDKNNDGKYLPSEYGKCDRINNCTYHLNPYKGGYHKETIRFTRHRKQNYSHSLSYRVRKQEVPKYDTVPPDLYLASGTREKYDTNLFTSYLKAYFGTECTNVLIREYCIGNSLNDSRATIFWQVSYDGEIRTGKNITYNIVPNSDLYLGKDIKRVKTSKPFLIHATIKPEFKVYPCFFGEHLLKRYPEKDVILVEAEKSAIIASVFYPDFVCIATGGSAGCRWATEYHAMKPLIGRKVIMYPDLKNTEAWEKRAAYLRENGVNAMVSKKLIDWATPKDLENDNDLADYLLRYDPAKPISAKSIELMQHKSKMMEQIKKEVPSSDTIRAYIDKEGRLYIETPLSDTYTIRESIEHYNKRSGSISFIKKNEMDITHCKIVFIDRATLTINPN